MKRTTLALDEDLLRTLKEKAAKNGTTLQAMANDVLRRGLAVRPISEGYRLRLEGWVAETRPGIDLLDRDSLLDAMDGG